MRRGLMQIGSWLLLPYWLFRAWLPGGQRDLPSLTEEELAAWAVREFRYALQAMAVSAPEQIRALSPGHVPEEIINEFKFCSEAFLSLAPKGVSAALAEQIHQLAEDLWALPEDVFSQDTDPGCMARPEWAPLRQRAKRILRELNWPIEPPPPYVYNGRGVYERR